MWTNNRTFKRLRVVGHNNWICSITSICFTWSVRLLLNCNQKEIDSRYHRSWNLINGASEHFVMRAYCFWKQNKRFQNWNLIEAMKSVYMLLIPVNTHYKQQINWLDVQCKKDQWPYDQMCALFILSSKLGQEKILCKAKSKESQSAGYYKYRNVKAFVSIIACD